MARRAREDYRRRPVGTRPPAACGAWPEGERATVRRRGPRRWSSGRSERKRLCVFSHYYHSHAQNQQLTAMILHLSQLQEK